MSPSQAAAVASSLSAAAAAAGAAGIGSSTAAGALAGAGAGVGLVAAAAQPQPGDGALSVAEESSLSQRQLLRLAVARRLASAMGPAPLALHAAATLPAPADPRCDWGGLFHWTSFSRRLYIRASALDAAGEPLLALASVLAAIRASPSDLAAATVPGTPAAAAASEALARNLTVLAGEAFRATAGVGSSSSSSVGTGAGAGAGAGAAGTVPSPAGTVPAPLTARSMSARFGAGGLGQGFAALSSPRDATTTAGAGAAGGGLFPQAVPSTPMAAGSAAGLRRGSIGIAAMAMGQGIVPASAAAGAGAATGITASIGGVTGSAGATGSAAGGYFSVPSLEARLRKYAAAAGVTAPTLAPSLPVPFQLGASSAGAGGGLSSLSPGAGGDAAGNGDASSGGAASARKPRVSLRAVAMTMRWGMGMTPRKDSSQPPATGGAGGAAAGVNTPAPKESTTFQIPRLNVGGGV